MTEKAFAEKRLNVAMKGDNGETFTARNTYDVAKKRKLQKVSESDQISASVRSTNNSNINEEEIISKSVNQKGRCQFWVAKKKRYCKCIPPKGGPFCIEHSPNNEDDLGKKRIPCPYDSKHTCYESHLERHMNKCNSRPGLEPIYYENNLNSGHIEDDDGKKGIDNIDVSELMKMINKVNELYLKYEKTMEMCERSHLVFEESLADPTNGQQAVKHLKQIASLIGNMGELSLLRPSTTYVEFGAGRGGLSHWIQRANQSDDCRFVLIDRSSVRYKKDSFHKGEDQGPSFERLKIDIEHLALGKVPSLEGISNDITCVGKHLCGSATDFMLRCLVNSKDSIQVKGVVLALCCHHRCTWGGYVGRAWMGENKICPEEFLMLVKMSAWATCGTKHVDEKDSSEHLEVKEAKSPYFHHRYGDLLPQQRQEIGFKCKRLIDIGRLKFLQENNYRCKLIQYVSPQTTLENFALTAVYGVNESN